ncbi:MAG TPA: ATP-binding cassette domain-containing protein, partial [Solirubrobacter sp.]|nr:ATP-binding cassette domain-containing protein [Solirubrobacter sp.]
RTAGLLAAAGAAAAAAGAGIALALGVAAPEDLSPLLALQLLAAAIAGGRYPLLGAVVIVALARAPAELTAVLLLAAVALRRYLPERLVRGGGGAPEPEPPATARGELAARGLHGALGGREILRGFDLDLRPGEIHALIGPNGSGKTTAVRILAGALKPRGGTVTGGPLARTFQRAAGFPALTPHRQALVAAQAADPVRLAGLWHAVGLAPDTDHDTRAWAALTLVGLQNRAHTPPDELTAGEQRLLQIARAVATQAPALALDEPAVGMTAGERATLERVLRALAAGGRAILVIEHDLRLVAALADTVTVLDEGRAIAHGPPETVIADATVQQVYLGVAAA